MPCWRPGPTGCFACCCCLCTLAPPPAAPPKMPGEAHMDEEDMYDAFPGGTTQKLAAAVLLPRDATELPISSAMSMQRNSFSSFIKSSTGLTPSPPFLPAPAALTPINPATLFFDLAGAFCSCLLAFSTVDRARKVEFVMSSSWLAVSNAPRTAIRSRSCCGLPLLAPSRPPLSDADEASFAAAGFAPPAFPASFFPSLAAGLSFVASVPAGDFESLDVILPPSSNFPMFHFAPIIPSDLAILACVLASINMDFASSSLGEGDAPFVAAFAGLAADPPLFSRPSSFL
mmetsp:Transcript_39159/g.83609  ORF Transcript_39159/g.83609 Transcript_39159/m.83609 type:complete len:287 (+) Transcript_39159:138-998(+)